MLSSCAFADSVSLDCVYYIYTCVLICLIGALINALGAVSLGAPIGMQYVSLRSSFSISFYFFLIVEMLIVNLDFSVVQIKNEAP
jgi:hypothetical protein